MSAIAGVCAWSGRIDPLDSCARLAAEPITLGFDRPRFAESRPVVFSHALRKTLPEDDFDRQPLSEAEGRFLLTADVRLDNRDELLSELGVSSAIGKSLADSAVLLLAWTKWGKESLERLLGDYAFAVWDCVKGTLTLVRAPMAMKSLFYCAAPDFVAFSSAPAALHRLGFIGNTPNLTFAASLAAGIYPTDGSTIHAGISQLCHGQAVEFKYSSKHVFRFWRISEQETRCRDLRDYGLGLRSELDRAVAAQLRTRGLAGVHLSAGRDSSAVAATAALQIHPDRLLAFTGAPRKGYPEFSAHRIIADESRLAAETATIHENIKLEICRRSTQSRLFQSLAKAHALHHEPLSNPTNLPWWWAIHKRAQRLGVTALLGGTAGNLTISVLGERHVVDLLRHGNLARWWRVTRGLAQAGNIGWPFLLRSSFAPWLPRQLDNLLLHASGRAHAFQKDASLLAEPYRTGVEDQFAEQLSDVRPPKSYYELRRKKLYEWVFSDRFSLNRFGIDFRDPTSDRRLIDYCLSLPVEALTSAKSSRPVYDVAFEDRVPASIRNLRARGEQSSDWQEMTNREELMGLIEHYWRSPAVAELFHRPAVEALAERWPRSRPLRENETGQFRDQLLATMSVASYLAVTYEGSSAGTV